MGGRDKGDAPSLRESPDLDAALSLLSEGLDLCVRAKKLDKAMTLAAAIGGVGMERPHGGSGTRCLTPALWVQDAYDRDLADWEARSIILLTRLLPVGALLGNRKDGSSQGNPTHG